MANSIGIDFGTTKTMVSYLDLTTGRPDIVCLGALQDSMPTTIYCDEAGEFLFGTAADEQIAKDPEGYCRAFKLHLGERDPILQRIEATAESLTKLFLLHVKEECEQKVFHGEPVTAATITVPVSFSPSRKAALKRAAEAAGFISVSFIPEPEAAGTAFLRENPSETFARALVLDWGGGTLDIAIVTRDADGKIHADHHCAEGRDDVGGEEIDRLLVSAGDQYWRKTFGVPLIESEEHEPRLLREAEQVKIGLSGKNTWIYRRGVKKVEVTREQFRQLIANLLDVAVDLVQSALRKNKALGNPAPDTILLIGGTSWIPAVRETMEKNFPDLRVLSWHRSQKAVALGATEVGTHASPNGNPQSGKAQAKQGALQQGGAKTSVNDKGDSFVITHAALRLFKRFAIVDGACNQREEDFMEVCSPGSTAELAWNDPSIKSESVRVLAQKTAYSYEGDEQKLFAVQGLLRALAECDGPEKPVERTALSVISLVFEKKPSSIPSFPTSQRQTLSVPNNFNKKNPCEKQVGHFDVVCPHCGHNEDVTGKGRWICDFCGNRFDVDEFRNVSISSESENTANASDIDEDIAIARINSYDDITQATLSDFHILERAARNGGAARNGNMRAMSLLGSIYHHGCKGITANPQKAYECWRSAADEDSDAMMGLAIFYSGLDDESPVRKNMAEALKWAEKAVEADASIVNLAFLTILHSQVQSPDWKKVWDVGSRVIYRVGKKKPDQFSSDEAGLIGQVCFWLACAAAQEGDETNRVAMLEKGAAFGDDNCKQIIEEEAQAQEVAEKQSDEDKFPVTDEALRLFARLSIVDGVCNQQEVDFMEAWCPGSTSDPAWRTPLLDNETIEDLSRATATSYNGDMGKLSVLKTVYRSFAECDGPLDQSENAALSWINWFFESGHISSPSRQPSSISSQYHQDVVPTVPQARQQVFDGKPPIGLSLRSGLVGGYVLRITNNASNRMSLHIESVHYPDEKIKADITLEGYATMELGWSEVDAARNFRAGEMGTVSSPQYTWGMMFAISFSGSLQVSYTYNRM